MNTDKSFIAIACFAVAFLAHANSLPGDEVIRDSALGDLYKRYATYHQAFSAYATRQGFTRPVEKMATVAHEIIHIDSFAHQGFFIDGTYYEPYLSADAWPRLNNGQLHPYLSESERRSSIYRLYTLQAPSNHLGNVVDEINAYGHVLPIVCRDEPQSADKQIKNLMGFLLLSEAYLRTLRTQLPSEYAKLAQQGPTRGVFGLIVQRAWAALGSCAVPIESIPAGETRYLLAQP